MNKNTFLLLITAVSALGGLLFGYDTGVINGAQFYLSKHFDLKKKYTCVDRQRSIGKKFMGRNKIRRNTKQNKSYAHKKEVPNAKLAKLKYSLIKELDRYTLLEIQLYTGRHHQIRAQLSAIGCCIKGDLKYGASRSNPDGSIHLHARHLFFEHPVKKIAISIIAPTPKEALWAACES